MTSKDFESSGLNKLSPAELAHLNAWLGSRVPVAVDRTGEPVFYGAESKREVIRSRIAGSFRGWSGKTAFALENDQVWQQAQSGSFGDISLADPEVRIRPMLMGGWLMYVDGCGCSVRVKRIK